VRVLTETSMTLETDFLTTAADKLVENLGRIEICLTELPPRAMWARDSENENAVGNLLLHLEGNVRQWILSGVGAGPDIRDRASEFSARAGAHASELFAKLHGTVGEAVDLIRSLPHPRLAEEVDHSPDQALHWKRSRFLQLLGQDGPERDRGGASSCGRVPPPSRLRAADAPRSIVAAASSGPSVSIQGRHGYATTTSTVAEARP
jgi:hypothetical protein